MIIFAFYLPLFISIILLYFYIARRYNIIDKPNHRSSHENLTIRGGGIIFPIAFLIHCLFSESIPYYFIIGLTLISIVSFYDDIQTLSSKLRLLVHVLAVSFLFYENHLYSWPFWLIILCYVIMIGSINAYNFMDGINGITGGYSLIVTLSLWFVNENIQFVDKGWIILTVLALITFNYFNFRRDAKCFAGDVGSISIAFVVLFFLLLLILRTEELKYTGFLLVYGLDSISTIILRLVRKENIFEAHRSHFYQFLTNNLRWPHLRASGLYILIQVILNIFIIRTDMNWTQLFVFFMGSGMFFVSVRYFVEGKKRLFGDRLSA